MPRHKQVGEELRLHDGSDLLDLRHAWNFKAVAAAFSDDFSAGTGAGWTADGDGNVNWTAAGASGYGVEAWGGPGGTTVVHTLDAAYNVCDMSSAFTAPSWADNRRHVPLLLKDGSTEILFVEIQRTSGVYHLRLGNNTHRDVPDFLIDVVMSIDPSAGYHTYRLVADFTEDLGGPQSGVGTAEVFVDGVSAGTYDASNSTKGNVASSATYNKIGFIGDSGFWNHHAFFDNVAFTVPSDEGLDITDEVDDNQTRITVSGGGPGLSLFDNQWVKYGNSTWDPSTVISPYKVNLGTQDDDSTSAPGGDVSFIGGALTNLANGVFEFEYTGLYVINFQVERSASVFPASPHGYRIQCGARNAGWEANLTTLRGGVADMVMGCTIHICDWFAAHEVINFRVSRGTTITAVSNMNLDTYIARLL